MASISETETVIKRILPYLVRRGFSVETDMIFEEPTKTATAGRVGFVDILITCGKSKPVFLIEAKRDGTKIAQKHRNQALDYGKSIGCLFVAITNGKTFELLNTRAKLPLRINGTPFDCIPTKDNLLKKVLPQLKSKPDLTELSIPTDASIPFRPGLPLSKLNHLFKQCHNTIRKIEKNEDDAFADFSKILFLKLLEEKWDIEGTAPPYSYQFHLLAETPKGQADQVKTAINSMIAAIRAKTPFGDVLADPIKLKRDNTYLAIIKALSSVSFNDCDLDTKGAAFEYFVRATLKGKKLGQYFTPRPLVRLMLHLGQYQQIVTSLRAGEPFKVLDPACGTGGFLVLAMNLSIADVEAQRKLGKIHATLATKLTTQLREDTFFGIDAHDGVASSAKMNMIVAGDGHTNIRAADTLATAQLVPTYKTAAGLVADGKAHLVLSNPPFGTSEAESLTSQELSSYEVHSTRGQSLFIQKMIAAAFPHSRIVTVIDDGVLNTSSYVDLREHILKSSRILTVLSLPDETFKPNKINVKASVLVLERRGVTDENLEDHYPIGFLRIESLGYDGAGESIRGFLLDDLIAQLASVQNHTLGPDTPTIGYYWHGFQVDSGDITADVTKRLDLKYWRPGTRRAMDTTRALPGSTSIKALNQITTRRGRSPSPAEYVSASEGYALVVKAGSNISKSGELLNSGDYIEKQLYDEYAGAGIVLCDGDILLSSTGDGTLGKCCVYRHYDGSGVTRPGIADGHTTVIRVDQAAVYPEYLCDFLRAGFGARQIERLYTGSTGLIEMPPEEVNRIVLPPLPPFSTQKERSNTLRNAERDAAAQTVAIETGLREQEASFCSDTMPSIADATAL